MKLIVGVCAALAISTVGLIGSTYASPAAEEQARQDITIVGCLRAWQPASADVTKMPETRHGMFVLTPLASTPGSPDSLPTYLLRQTLTVNFQAHLDDKVEVVGAPEAAPPSTAVRLTVTQPQPRPENLPAADLMPRLTVRTLRKISDTCPS
jgi:hypothetical protein